MAHVRSVVQRLPCQHFQDSQSKSTCQDSKNPLDKRRFHSFRSLQSWFVNFVAMVSMSMHTEFVTASQSEIGYTIVIARVARDLWPCAITITYWLFCSTCSELHSSQQYQSEYEPLPYAILAIVMMFYPLSGFIADVCCG